MLLSLLFVTPSPDVFVGSMLSTARQQGRADSPYFLHFFTLNFLLVLFLSHHRLCFDEQSVTGRHSHLILTGLKVSSIYRPFKGILSVFGPSQNDKHAGIGSRMKEAGQQDSAG